MLLKDGTQTLVVHLQNELTRVREEGRMVAESSFRKLQGMRGSEKIERMCLNNPAQVFAGANLTHTKFRNHRHPDAVHLSMSGYELAATDMLDNLLKMAQMVEAKILMKAMQEQSTNEEEEVDAVAAGTKKDR